VAEEYIGVRSYFGIANDRWTAFVVMEISDAEKAQFTRERLEGRPTNSEIKRTYTMLVSKDPKVRAEGQERLSTFKAKGWL